MNNSSKEEFCEKFEVLGKKKLVKDCKKMLRCQQTKCKKELENMKKIKSSSKMQKITKECIKKHNKVENVGLCVYKKMPKKNMKELTNSSQKISKCSEDKCKKELKEFTKTMVNSMIKKKLKK